MAYIKSEHLGTISICLLLGKVKHFFANVWKYFQGWGLQPVHESNINMKTFKEFWLDY